MVVVFRATSMRSKRLPGIGPYTARAVAAIAFGRRVGPVDVNVRRVLTRLASAIEAPLQPRALQAIADDLVPARRPADWTHAVMDIGATVCRQATPRCVDCPARPWCAFGRAGARRPAVTPTSSAGRTAGEVPFEGTSRWLRGRIVRRLTEAPDGQWVAIEAPIGGHDEAAVADAMRALAADGLVEIDGDGRLFRLPSPAVAAR